MAIKQHRVSENATLRLERLFKPITAIFILFALTGIVIWFFYDNSIGGPEYRAAQMKCGKEPVTGYINVKTKKKSYITPASPYYQDYVPLSANKYFCDLKGAKTAGFESQFKLGG